jgi:hypothetical protein
MIKKVIATQNERSYVSRELEEENLKLKSYDDVIIKIL